MKQVKYKQQANVKSCQIRGRCIVFPDIQWNILTGHLPLENDSECSTSELQSFPLSPNHRTASPTKQTFYDIDECSQIFTCTIYRKIHTYCHILPYIRYQTVITVSANTLSLGSSSGKCTWYTWLLEHPS